MKIWLWSIMAAGVGLAGCHLVAGLDDIGVSDLGGGAGAQGGAGGAGGATGGGGTGGMPMCNPADCDALDTSCRDFSCEDGTLNCDEGVEVPIGDPCRDDATRVCDSQENCVDDLCVNGVIDVANEETDEDCGGTICSPCDNTRMCALNRDCRSNNCVDGGGGAGGSAANGTCEPCTDAGNNCEPGTYCDDENAIPAQQICKDEEALGTVCERDEQCDSGNCVDGVCCDTACDGAQCESCLGAQTGGTDGTCAPISAGTDPDNECTENLSPNGFNGCEGNACSGTAAACAPAASGVCRAANGACDVAESCNGTALGCPPDGFYPGGNSVSCRAQNGDCDVEEFCPGSGPNCPADGFAVGGNTVTCRFQVGPCDLQEFCTGSSPTCPADGFANNGTPCGGAPSGACDVQDFCDGTSAACPDLVEPATTECDADSGPCDIQDFCDGATKTCTLTQEAAGTSTGMCNGYLCDGGSFCPTTCDPLNMAGPDADCEITHYCAPGSPATCTMKVGSGFPCTADNQCVSGDCTTTPGTCA